MYPFGRRKFEPELLPLLDAVAAMGADRPQGRVQPAGHPRERAPGPGRVRRAGLPAGERVVRRDLGPRRPGVHPAGGLVPAVRRRCGCRSTTPASSRRAGPPTGPVERLPRVLVSSGGGMVGEPLVRAAVRVHREVAARTGLRTTIVAGPFLPDAGVGVAAGARRLPRPARRGPSGRRPLPRDAPFGGVAEPVRLQLDDGPAPSADAGGGGAVRRGRRGRATAPGRAAGRPRRRPGAPGHRARR